MRLVVYPQHLVKDGGLEVEPPSLVAAITKGRLVVVGTLPYNLEGPITAEDINGLSGDLATAMFFVLAGSKYGPYDKVELEGVDAKEVVEYVNKNFSSREAAFILRGLPSSQIRDEIVNAIMAPTEAS